MSAAVNQETVSTSFKNVDIAELLAFHRGWIDGQHRAAWPRCYEAMPVREQFMYEQGRLSVVNVMKIGPVPRWKGDRHTACGPVEDALFRSIDEVGCPW